MGSTTEKRTASSSEKKRLRDRRAQQNLRDKRLRHLKGLEDRVAYCKQHHGVQWVDELLDRVKRLENEGQLLRTRLTEIRDTAGAFDDGDPPVKRTSTGATFTPTKESLTPPTINNQSTTQRTTTPCASVSATSPVLTTPSPTMLADDTLFPACIDPALTAGEEATLVTISPLAPASIVGTAWSLLPPNDDSDPSLGAASCPWLLNRELITACPLEPDPLSLLHGTRENYLSNAIWLSLRGWLCCDPEKVAMGYIIYVWSRWRVCPTPETFSLLPTWLRPVLGQLQKTHPSCIDQCVWPQLRLNMINHLKPHQIPETIGLLACCLKVRWAWDEDILERDERNTLQIRQEYHATFMREDGWGLTQDFFECFPDLVQGLDRSKVLYSLGSV